MRPAISGSIKSVGEALQRQQALGPVANGADDGLVPMANQTHPPQRPSCHPTGWRLVLIDVVLKSGNEPDPGRGLDMHTLVTQEGRERTAAEVGQRPCAEWRVGPRVRQARFGWQPLS